MKIARIARVAAWMMTLGVGSALAGGGDIHGDPGTPGEHAQMKLNKGASEAGIPLPDDSAAQQALELVLSTDDRTPMQRLALHRGDIVRFTLRNPSSQPALVMLGTQAMAASHAAMMRNYVDMKHSAPGRVSVGANGQASFTWQFTHVGDFTLAQINATKREAKVKVLIAVSE